MAAKNVDGWDQATKVGANTGTVAPESHHPFGKGFSDEHQSTQTSRNTSPKDARSNATKSKGQEKDFDKNATLTAQHGFGKPNPPGVALPKAWQHG